MIICGAWKTCPDFSSCNSSPEVIMLLRSHLANKEIFFFFLAFSIFFFFFFQFIYFNWRLITLKYCSGFAIH